MRVRSYDFFEAMVQLHDRLRAFVLCGEVRLSTPLSKNASLTAFLMIRSRSTFCRSVCGFSILEALKDRTLLITETRKRWRMQSGRKRVPRLFSSWRRPNRQRPFDHVQPRCAIGKSRKSRVKRPPACTWSSCHEPLEGHCCTEFQPCGRRRGHELAVFSLMVLTGRMRA